MDINRFQELAEKFRRKHILVIGDLMLDSYMWGNTSRISPEAPVPVVAINNVTHNPGGAANVGWNISSLSANVTMAGLIGDDDHGVQLASIMSDRKINIDGVFCDINNSTTVKTRIIAQGQQVVRTDFETNDSISKPSLEKIQSFISLRINEIDGIILSDYNKGLLSKNMIAFILSLAADNQTPVYVDPKKNNFFDFKGVRLFKPNAHEFFQSQGVSPSETSGQELRKKLNADTVLITLGDEGMLLIADNKNVRIPTKARAVHDVSGAGDTVISTFALSDLSGADLDEAATLANLAAGRVCEEVGVVPINLQMMEDIFTHHF